MKGPSNVTFALEYARAGLPVFPVWGMRPDGTCACGGCPSPRDAGKHPVGYLAPDGLKSATTDVQRVNDWWARAGDTPLNIGIAVPKGYAVVDVDPKNGGNETWAALTAQHGTFPETDAVATGGGGFHVWVRLPDPDFRLPGRLGPGIDVRQDGGFVVAPPSLHASGKRYEWIKGRRPAAPAPEWITQRGYRQTNDEKAAQDQLEAGRVDPPTQPEHVHVALAAALAPYCVDGQKHNLAKAVGGWLRQRGWTAGDVVATLQHLPFHDARKRIAGALNCWAAGKQNGWDELQALVGAPIAQWLDAGTPNVIREQIKAEHAAISDWWVAEIESRVQRPPPGSVAVPLPPVSADDPFCGLPVVRANLELTPLRRIVEGLDIVHGFTTALIGRPFTAKTPLAMTLALCLANGLPFAGRPTLQTRVVYLAAEKIHGVDRVRVRVAKTLGVDPESVPLVNLRSLPLNAVGMVDRLREVSRRQGFPLFILDTYGASVVGLEHNSAVYAEPLKAATNALTEMGAAVMIIMHAKKGDGIPTLQDAEGHSAMAGAVEGAITLHRPDADDRNTIDVLSSRTLDREQPPLRVKFSDPPIEGFDEPGLAIEAVNREAESIAGADEPGGRATAKQRMQVITEGKILAYLTGHPGAVSYDVLRNCAPTPKDARDILRDLLRAGKITLAKVGTEEHYSLRDNTLC